MVLIRMKNNIYELSRIGEKCHYLNVEILHRIKVENAMSITAPQDISNHLHAMTDDDNSR